MTALWAQLDTPYRLMAAWLALACLDVLTGWLAALVTRTVSSRVSWSGVMRKAITAAVIVVVAITNAIAPYPLDNFPLLVPALIGFIGSEVFSIFENARRAGISIPGLTSRLDGSTDVPNSVRSSGAAAGVPGGNGQGS